MTQYERWTAARTTELIGRFADQEGALLPMLHALHDCFGHIPDEATPLIADALNLSRADVHGVITFYHDFRRMPPTLPVIKLCRAEACQARGGEALAADAERLAAGRVDIDAVYCLGLCASGPSAKVGDRVFARLDAASLGQLIDEVAA